MVWAGVTDLYNGKTKAQRAHSGKLERGTSSYPVPNQLTVFYHAHISKGAQGQGCSQLQPFPLTSGVCR